MRLDAREEEERRGDIDGGRERFRPWLSFLFCQIQTGPAQPCLKHSASSILRAALALAFSFSYFHTSGLAFLIPCCFVFCGQYEICHRRIASERKLWINRRPFCKHARIVSGEQRISIFASHFFMYIRQSTSFSLFTI